MKPYELKKFFLKVFLPFSILISCSEVEVELQEISGVAMTMPYRILIPSEVDGNRAITTITETFQEVNAIYNKWNPNSEISRFNNTLAGTSFPLSEPLKNFLIRTGNFVQLTQGKFDPTVEPLQRLWKTRLLEGKKPLKEELASLMTTLGWDRVLIWGNEGLLKRVNGVELDLGGIAKGLAIDLMAERFLCQGIENFYIEWGGEIRVSGTHPSGRPWTVFIPKCSLYSPEINPIAILALQDQAIATSGDYAQFWAIEDEGIMKHYFHILDTSCGHFFEIHPKSVASATAIADDCVTADVLASYLMTFKNVEDARLWARNYQKDNPRVKTWIFSREEMESSLVSTQELAEKSF